MATTDLAIIGSGIIGNGIAYQLAMRGVTNILMLGREVVARSSNGRATGGIRQQFADELDILFSQERFKSLVY